MLLVLFFCVKYKVPYVLGQANINCMQVSVKTVNIFVDILYYLMRAELFEANSNKTQCQPCKRQILYLYLSI